MFLITFNHDPGTKLVLHSCDNPRCVNPNHLRLGTAKENTLEMFQKGRDRHLRGEEISRSKLTTENVIQIRQRWLSGGEKQSSIAKDFAVSQGTISEVARGIRWQHVPMPT